MCLRGVSQIRMPTCARIEHDADRHAVCAQPYRDAQPWDAQGAVQLMCPAQQSIAVLLHHHTSLRLYSYHIALVLLLTRHKA